MQALVVDPEMTSKLAVAEYIWPLKTETLSSEDRATKVVNFVHIPMSSSRTHSRELVDADPCQDFVVAPGQVVGPVMKLLIDPS